MPSSEGGGLREGSSPGEGGGPAGCPPDIQRKQKPTRHGASRHLTGGPPQATKEPHDMERSSHHPQLSHPRPGKNPPSSVGPKLPARGPGHRGQIALTLDEQVGGVDGLPLDAVRATGVGTSVLPTDRSHRQAAVTHLWPRRVGLSSQPWARQPHPRWKWPGAHAPGDTEAGFSLRGHGCQPLRLPPPAPPAPLQV